MPGVASRLNPLGLRAATIEEGFWADRQRLNADVIIEHCRSWMDRAGWIDNLALARAGTVVGNRRGREFSDSEIYKLLEAMCWEVGRSHDPALDTQVRELTAMISSAQESDGYLNTNFGRPGQKPRYSDLEWGHELYCYGHLIQAAVARGRTVGLDDELVQIARRVADHVVVEFGATGRNGICGHPCIEVALAEFGRLLGDDRYIDQAALFLARRGHRSLGEIEFGPEYFQDDIPIREADVLRGHAVRALYLAAAAVDVAVERADDELLGVLERQWEATVYRRTYITGGMGSRHEGEAFGIDWELPSDRAYCETCAGVGAIMFSWRLLLATGNPRYSDLVERVLFNVVATSPSADGRAFFYSNTLHRREAGRPTAEGELEQRAGSPMRAPWFSVSCCPPNVSRTFALLGTYLATVDGAGLQVHQYASATIRAMLDAGAVAVRITTDYPREGTIVIEVVETPDAEWTLSVRVPGWAAGATLQVGYAPAEGVEPGVAILRRAFEAGDRIVLTLPVAPRFTYPDQRIDGIRGMVAVERGPEVYCLESTDTPHGDVDEVIVDDSVLPTDLESGVLVRCGVGMPADHGWPYKSTLPENPAAVADVVLRPYHDWGNRGPSTMRVWMRSYE